MAGAAIACATVLESHAHAIIIVVSSSEEAPQAILRTDTASACCLCIRRYRVLTSRTVLPVEGKLIFQVSTYALLISIPSTYIGIAYGSTIASASGTGHLQYRVSGTDSSPI
eukprot:3058431-Rhodomonas_salina.1